jgi:dipeptide/tripeptide permease
VREGLGEQLRRLTRAFWMLNVMEMLERLAYYGVRVVIPIYIAQADEIHGLHFTFHQKGDILFWWALVQAGVPIFSGGFADRYGYKKTIAASIVIKMAGYILMATQRSYEGFLLGCLVLAFGTAIFKPGVWGAMQRSLTKEQSSTGWGIFYMLVNIGGFLGPPLAHYLHGISWPTVFYGCAIIVSLNFFMLLTFPSVDAGADQSAGVLKTIGITITNLFQPRLLAFILIMSGFWLMFMQLFDLLPNFIVDWTDSSAWARHLPTALTTPTPRGPMIAQEWMVNLDAFLIIGLVVWVAYLASRMRRVHSIFVGILVACVGLMLAGGTMSGGLCLLGIAIFAFGEMLSSPKMNDYLGVIAPEDKKGLYMGYANMPTAIGWAYGSKLAGNLYENLGEKAGLALRWLKDHGGVPAGVDRTTALDAMQRVAHTDAAGATRMLWDAYHPWKVWVPLVGIGVASAIAILFYAQWAKKYEAPDI